MTWKGWPFEVGDKVVCTGDWGPLVCDLRTYDEQNQGSVYTVHDVSDGGRWLSLRNADGRIFGSNVPGAPAPAPAYGPSYFRLVSTPEEH